ncbi:MAG: DUF5606 domain-containing protein [Prevotellaceae bacterium]|jgi:hypothetical protein|nr:DUF5606 domain-containing protein [Prevotellaceae bacterium]
MQTDLQKIVSISGQPGLFKYLSQARHGTIVESIKDGKRTCVPASVKVSSMAEITVYASSGDDLPLKEVFTKIRERNGGEKAISHKSPVEELMAYFEETVPECNKEKIYPHHVKKIIAWYNILQENQMLDFVEDKKEEQEEARDGDESENSSSNDLQQS